MVENNVERNLFAGYGIYCINHKTGSEAFVGKQRYKTFELAVKDLKKWLQEEKKGNWRYYIMQLNCSQDCLNELERKEKGV